MQAEDGSSADRDTLQTPSEQVILEPSAFADTRYRDGSGPEGLQEELLEAINNR